jgi:enamine deaminase RidA (YjgF/YER057c/UK114 family)
MTQAIERINPRDIFDSTQTGYSQGSAVEAGRLAFFSGQVAWTPDSSTAPDSLAEQGRIVNGHLKRCLAAVGAEVADIVMMRVYVVNLTPERGAELLPVVREFLGEVQPSLTGIGVQALWGPDLQLEVEMAVRVPPS